MSTPTPSGHTISNAVSNWNSINKLLQQINEEYKQDLQSLICMCRTMHDPGKALWLFQLDCMPLLTQSGECNMQLESDALNIANAIRSDVTSAQNAWNNFLNDLAEGNTAAGKSAVKALQSALNQVSKDIHQPGMTKILGSNGVKSISSFLSALKNATSGVPGNHMTNKATRVPETVWHSKVVWNTGMTKWFTGLPKITTKGGDAHHTRWASGVTRITKFIPTSVPNTAWSRLYSEFHKAVHSGGQLPPELSNITTTFNELSQSVSGVSSSIQTQMQYVNQNLQQLFGTYSSFFQDFSQLNSYIINQYGANG